MLCIFTATKRIYSLIKNYLKDVPENFPEHFAAYIVNNHFHPRLKEILKYYNPK